MHQIFQLEIPDFNAKVADLTVRIDYKKIVFI